MPAINNRHTNGESEGLIIPVLDSLTRVSHGADAAGGYLMWGFGLGRSHTGTTRRDYSLEIAFMI